SLDRGPCRPSTPPFRSGSQLRLGKFQTDQLVLVEAFVVEAAHVADERSLEGCARCRCSAPREADNCQHCGHKRCQSERQQSMLTQISLLLETLWNTGRCYSLQTPAVT